MVATISPQGIIEMLNGASAAETIKREHNERRCGHATSRERLKTFEAVIAADDIGEKIRNVSIITGHSFLDAGNLVRAARQS